VDCASSLGWHLPRRSGLFHPEVAEAIKALGKIRHRLAHGSDEEVTKSDVRSLFAEFEEIVGDGRDCGAEELDQASEIDQLQASVWGIWDWMGFDASVAVAKRAELDAALAENRKQAGGLPERIRELLQQNSVATPTIANETHRDGA
jgi:hypothetical protein